MGAARRVTAAGRAVALLVLAGLLAAHAPVAAAHPDIEAASGTHRLAPGQALAFPVEMHYHRVVGHVRTADPQADVALLLEGPGAERRRLMAGADYTVNLLIACCKGEDYAERTLRVQNQGPAAVEVSLRLTLLHDGLAVVNDDSEEGALRTIVGLPVVVALVCALGLSRPLDPAPETAWRTARRAAVALALLWGVSGALAAWGMFRYGGGPVIGTLTATADLPPTGNVILTTHSVLTIAFLLLWVACVGLWTRAARRVGADADRRRIARLGLLLGGGAVVACALWAVEYGALLAPLLAGVAAASFPLGGAAWLAWARGPRTPAERPAEDAVEAPPSS